MRSIGSAGGGERGRIIAVLLEKIVLKSLFYFYPVSSNLPLQHTSIQLHNLNMHVYTGTVASYPAVSLKEAFSRMGLGTRLYRYQNIETQNHSIILIDIKCILYFIQGAYGTNTVVKHKLLFYSLYCVPVAWSTTGAPPPCPPGVGETLPGEPVT